MANEFDGVAKSTYVDADERTYRALSYDILAEIKKSQMDMKCHCGQREKICEEKFTKLERRRYYDKAILAITGFLGGLMAGLLGKDTLP